MAKVIKAGLNVGVRENAIGNKIGHILPFRNVHNLIGYFDFSVPPFKAPLYIFNHFQSIEQGFVNCVYIDWERLFKSV